MGDTDLLEKTLMLGRIEGKRKRATEDEIVGRHPNSMVMSLSTLQEIVKYREA